MVKKFTVDVVIPVHNGGPYLEQTLTSVFTQSYPIKSIIVSDDGSTDNTKEIVRKFADNNKNIIYLFNEQSGVSSARNKGILASDSEFIAFLDSDDIWEESKIEAQMDLFSKNESLGFVHSSYFCIDKNSLAIINYPVFEPRLRGDIFEPLLLGGYVLSGSASSVVVRRHVLDKVGYFDERLFYGEDWDLWLRLAQVSKVDFTPEAVVGIRVHDNSAQRRARPGRALQFFQQQLLVYSKWENFTANNDCLKSHLRQLAIDAVLPVLQYPVEALAFQRSLAKSESMLARSVVDNALTFWLKVGFRVLDILWRRAKRKVGLNGR